MQNDQAPDAPGTPDTPAASDVTPANRDDTDTPSTGDRPDARPSHYFDAEPAVAPGPGRTVTVRTPKRPIRLRTARGLFSPDQVDTGTDVLLRGESRPRDGGTLLDLGCGYGPIALTLASDAPDATVWAIDVNERARTLTSENAAANDLPNVRVAAPGDVPADVSFDQIWSNPPIRIGKAALHDLLLTWFARLREGGTAHLVVHKNLGSDSLQTWLTNQGYPTIRVISSKGYRILRSTKPDGELD